VGQYTLTCVLCQLTRYCLHEVSGDNVHSCVVKIHCMLTTQHTRGHKNDGNTVSYNLVYVAIKPRSGNLLARCISAVAGLNFSLFTEHSSRTKTQHVDDIIV
jgi:hypothetical protein